MNRKQLITLVAVAFVAGLASLIIYQRSLSSWKQSTTGGSGKILGDFPLNEVAHISITSPEGALNLAKKGDAWVVKERGDYPAGFDQIGELIRKLWDLKSVQEVKAGPSQFGRLELTEPQKGKKDGATVVELDDKSGRQMAALWLGKKYMRGAGGEGGYPAGRYVLPMNGDKKVWLVSEVFEQIEPKPPQWLQRDFIHIERIKSVAVSGTSAAQTWKLIRDTENADWKLSDAAPGDQLDNAKVPPFQNLIGSPGFSDVMQPDTKPEAAGLDKPVTVVVGTFDNLIYTLKVGKLTGDNYAVSVAVAENFPAQRTPSKDEKPEDKARLDKEFSESAKRLKDQFTKEKKFEPWIYLLQRSAIDSLLKDRTQLMVEKKAEPSPSPAGSPVVTPAVSAGPVPSRTPASAIRKKQ